MGLGHPAVRDLISFLRYEEYDSQGKLNPLLDLKIENVYGWGRSQSGRLIRDFVYQGYNKDQKGRKVFDGLMPHVSGAGMLWMNHRFANTVTPAGQEHEYHENCADSTFFNIHEAENAEPRRAESPPSLLFCAVSATPTKLRAGEEARPPPAVARRT